MNNNYNYDYNSEYQMTAVRKGKKAPVIIGISAALLLGGCGAAYAAVPAVNNAVNKTFMSSENYCRKVYSKAFDDAASALEDYSNKSGDLYSSAFSIEFSDDIKSTINEYLDSDICGKVSFECQTGFSKSNDSIVEYKGVIKADGNDAVSADMIYDSKNGVFYLSLPELSSKVLKFESADDDQNNNFSIPKVCYGDYSKLISEYVKILEKYSANDKTVMISDSVGMAAGVTYSYTKLVTVFDGEQAKSFLEDTADFMEKSQLLKDLYDNYSSKYQAYSDELTFENAINNIRNTDISDFKNITIETLVDLNGDIRGISISQGVEKLFSFAEAKNNKDIGIRIDFADDISVIANAKENNKEYSGTLKIENEDEVVFSVDFSELEVKKNNIKGSVSCDVPNALSENDENEKMIMKFSLNDKSQNFEMYSDKIGKIVFTSEHSKNNTDIKIPENAEKVDDFSSISDYFDNEDALNSILEKFGLSEDIFDFQTLYSQDDMGFGSFDDDYEYYSDDDDMFFNFEFNDDDSDWTVFEDGDEPEGSWQVNEDGYFEWVPAA